MVSRKPVLGYNAGIGTCPGGMTGLTRRENERGDIRGSLHQVQPEDNTQVRQVRRYALRSLPAVHAIESVVLPSMRQRYAALRVLEQLDLPDLRSSQRARTTQRLTATLCQGKLIKNW